MTASADTIASHYHQRFYGGPPDAESVRYGKSVIAEFVATLESLHRPARPIAA